MVATATDFRVEAASLAGECTIADRSFAVSITGLTGHGCEARFDSADQGGWERDTDFCKLTIADQLTVNGHVIAVSGNSAQIGFFGHIHPVAVAKLQHAAC